MNNEPFAMPALPAQSPVTGGSPSEATAEAGDQRIATADATTDSAAIDALIAARRQTIVATVLAEIAARQRAPRATYRCQFHVGFGFREAAAIVPYLRSLGISHLYASPILRARPGSEHGYDICDYQALDPELGGEAAFEELLAALAHHGLGLILDIVPNHMSTHTANRWWADVLENGQSSPFAKYFDIDWHPVKPELAGKVLLPMLGNQYGAVLEAGELRIEYHEGAFFVRYADRQLPMEPRTTTEILAAHLDELRAALADSPDVLAEYESILTALAHLPEATNTVAEAVVERQRDKEVIKRRLRELTAASPHVEQFIAGRVAEINGTVGAPASFDRLDAVLATQAYRLCHWKAASDEVNYRRFFDVNELAAVCMEDSDAFYQSHHFVLQMAAVGHVHGLRIDHIDGLYAPEQYLWRLQWAYLAEMARRAISTVGSPAPAAAAHAMAPAGPSNAASSAEASWADEAPHIVVELCRQLGLPLPADDDWHAVLGRPQSMPPESVAALPAAEATPSNVRHALPMFVVVEKILGPHEPLPESWPVAGTTGYDFLQMCDGLFIADDGWRQLKRDYMRFTAQTAPFEAIARDSKRLILRVAMAGELQMLAHRLNNISEQHRRSRDFTLNLLSFALRETLVCFPVYRIYPGARGVSERDRRSVTQAVAQARRNNPAIDPGVFDFVRDVLLLSHPDGLKPAAIHEREFFAGRFQQVTSPVMAKGVEDTAFYSYCPLLSVNEVGNGPESPTTAPSMFHAWNQQRAACYPQAMLASSTHDTKRSEDVRARLHSLSEMPRPWRAAVQRWQRLNRRRRTNVDGQDAPSRNDEYLFYQSLLGIWPTDPVDSPTQATIVERMRGYMSKATHEAKRHTSWISPNEAYDKAVDDFVTSSLSGRSSIRFLAVFRTFQERIAQLGYLTTLSELVLRLTSPGFPDIYNGQELWSFRLVDPDNRAPVDYDERRRLLDEIEQALAAEGGSKLSLARQMASDISNPRTKLYVISQLLRLREQCDALFATGRYVPLAVAGERAENVVAFARIADESAGEQGASALVVVPRLIARLTEATSDNAPAVRLPLGADVWRDTAIEVPPEIAGEFTDVLTGAPRTLNDSVALSTLFTDFPVVVLSRRP